MGKPVARPKRKICVVTGSRADYGLLLPVMRAIDAHKQLQLQLIVTGTHLSPEYGYTVDAVKKDGFQIDAQVPMPLDNNSAAGVTKALGAVVIGLADTLEQLQPEMLLLLGDRYEILGAAQAALIACIPVAHIAGGDITHGAFDDCIRHSITKMSHLHFVTNPEARRRVIQMGEIPRQVFLVGSPGIDQIRMTSFLEQEEVERRLEFKLRQKNIVVTFHPPTLDEVDAATQFKQLLEALSYFKDEIGVVITGANADPRGREINQLIHDYVAHHDNATAHMSLGQQCYYSLVRLADAVVGNSSSGLYEAPSLEVATVNIGDRQEGRPQAKSVINCAPEANAIKDAIAQALNMDCRSIENPYGDGHTTERIIDVLAGPWVAADLIKKYFRDLDDCKQ